MAARPARPLVRKLHPVLPEGSAGSPRQSLRSPDFISPVLCNKLHWLLCSPVPDNCHEESNILYQPARSAPADVYQPSETRHTPLPQPRLVMPHCAPPSSACRQHPGAFSRRSLGCRMPARPCRRRRSALPRFWRPRLRCACPSGFQVTVRWRDARPRLELDGESRSLARRGASAGSYSLELTWGLGRPSRELARQNCVRAQDVYARTVWGFQVMTRTPPPQNRPDYVTYRARYGRSVRRPGAAW